MRQCGGEHFAPSAKLKHTYTNQTEKREKIIEAKNIQNTFINVATI